MLDDRYTEDNFYRKGAFHVQFQIEPTDELDPKARRRALQELLLALRDEVGLKISTFIDVEELDAEPEEEPETATAEFVIYNKLGVTSLAKLRRFMEQHLLGDVQPRIVLVDPQTSQKFRCTEFTIGYLFHDFIAHQPPDDWNRLRELLRQEDRGYRELTQRRQGSIIRYHGYRYQAAER